MTGARHSVRTYAAIIIGPGRAGPSLAHRLTAAGRAADFGVGSTRSVATINLM
jgi:predicted dinucleotide-binding enzyme